MFLWLTEVNFFPKIDKIRVKFLKFLPILPEKIFFYISELSKRSVCHETMRISALETTDIRQPYKNFEIGHIVSRKIYIESSQNDVFLKFDNVSKFRTENFVGKSIFPIFQLLRSEVYRTQLYRSIHSQK